MFLRKSILLILALGILAIASPALAQELLITHPTNTTTALPKKELKRILLGKTKKWQDGNKIVLATLSKGPFHDAFVKRYARKTAKQFTNYWRKMLFSGKGKMPKLFTSQKQLIAFVASTQGAVGYIDSSNKTDAVKVIRIVKHP